MSESIVCNLCRHADTQLYCRKDGIDVVRCRCCGLIFAASMQKKEDLIKHYSDGYFEPYLKTQSFHLKKRFKKRIQDIKQIVFPGRLLDVGCGAGFFLKLAEHTGYKVEGVELSHYAAKYARDQLGLHVFQGELGDAGFVPKSFDIITLWHIVEHVHDPKNFLIQVDALLKDNGLLAMEVPNIGSPVARMAGVHWELMAPKEHFYYFDVKTMKRYLEESGFKVIRMQTFIWTTIAMIFRAKAASRNGLSRFLLYLLAALTWCLSFIRFRNLPASIIGDVLTVYAVKKRGTA
jgi:2-polyprenyl-3-methyl-5-hydroxy-6-metoxy-1,4-benzoquinol methylase